MGVRKGDRQLLARYNRTMYTKYVMNEHFSEELIKVSLNHKLEGSHSSNE